MEDDIPDQMCPNCEIGQAVIKGFNAARNIGIQACDTLEKARNERIKKLEELLIEYGSHQLGCSAQYNTTHSKYRCRCGWDREREKALKG